MLNKLCYAAPLIAAAYFFGIASGYFIYSNPPLRWAQAQTNFDKTAAEIFSREEHFQLRALELQRELNQKQKECIGFPAYAPVTFPEGNWTYSKEDKAWCKE